MKMWDAKNPDRLRTCPCGGWEIVPFEAKFILPAVPGWEGPREVTVTKTNMMACTSCGALLDGSLFLPEEDEPVLQETIAAQPTGDGEFKDPKHKPA